MSRGWTGLITLLALVGGAQVSEATALFTTTSDSLNASASFSIADVNGQRQLTILLTNTTDNATGTTTGTTGTTTGTTGTASQEVLTGLVFFDGTSNITLGGLDFGLVAGAWPAPSIDSAITGAAFIEGTAKFVLNVPGNLEEKDISNVYFTYGAPGSENQLLGVSTFTAVPEPATLSLLGIALAGVGYRLRRRKA